MKSINRFMASLAALLILSSFALPAAARAAQSGDTTGSQSRTTTTAAGEDIKNATDPQKTTLLTEQLKEKGQAAIQTAKQNHQEKTEAQRQNACDGRKNALTHRMANAVTQAKKHQQVFDSFYTKIKNFYTTKQLNVSNYADLTAKVDAAQASAQTSVDALAGLNVSIDCASPTVGTDVATFQQAVQTARDSLKAYRAALTDLVSALKGASSANSSTNSTTQ